MRIDAHVHYMPPERAEDLARLVQQEPYWGLLLGPKSIQGWASAERMIVDMERGGLDRVVLVGEYFQQHAACVARNDQTLELVRRWPDRIIGLATIQPKAGRQALDELARCVAGGLRGVGELNPYAQGFTLNDPDFLRLVEACLEYDIPLNLHVNEAVGHYYPGKSTTPLRHYYRLAKRFPELKLILAHWGGGLLFYEMMPGLAEQLKNVWYDTAASPLLYPTEKIFSVALQCVDHQKILYGSDYPLRLYPRRQKEPDFQPFIAEIDQLGLNPDVLNDIMGHNVARLFGLLAPRCADTAPTQAQEEGAPAAATEIRATMAIGLIVEAWPETRDVFDRFGLPWQDQPVPHWEPIQQAVAARGWSPVRQQSFLDALNAAISA